MSTEDNIALVRRYFDEEKHSFHFNFYISESKAYIICRSYSVF